MSKIAAGFLIFQNRIIVYSIANQRTIISINASIGFSIPKKIIDQRVFKTSCIENTTRAFFLMSFFSDNHIMDTAIPMRINRVVQTGANIQLGGLNDGFTMPVYQPLIAGVVKIDPIIPASWQIIMNVT